jgi:dCTP deaminase
MSLAEYVADEIYGNPKVLVGLEKKILLELIESLFYWNEHIVNDINDAMMSGAFARDVDLA